MKSIMILLTASMLISFTTSDKLTGRWETQPSEKGNITGVVFKNDNTFEGYVNRKPFVSGSYKLKDNIFSFSDNGCEGKEGVYKIIFFSNDDSLRLEPVSDECNERKNGMSRLVLGRVR